MPNSINALAKPRENSPTGVPRLRTVLGNRFPTKCGCGCNSRIPSDPHLRVVVDFGAKKPFPTYFEDHSPDYRGARSNSSSRQELRNVPSFVSADQLPREPPASPSPPPRPEPVRDVAHSEDDSSPNPEAGRPWSSGQLVFNAGQFESARAGFAAYALDGESAERLRARVNRVILEDLEQKVLALRALHLRLDARGASFGDVVAKSRPI